MCIYSIYNVNLFLITFVVFKLEKILYIYSIYNTGASQ